jgi:sodium-independent sulfate anion transporter 11
VSVINPETRNYQVLSLLSDNFTDFVPTGTAIKSKAGVRTPLAGIFTAIIVLLALYALTAVFFYIPMATLAAIIIHAVGDLITPPNVVFQFWETSP